MQSDLACSCVQVHALRRQLERVQAERDSLQAQLLMPDRPAGEDDSAGSPLAAPPSARAHEAAPRSRE